jgi:hypothetical protein
MFILVQLYYIVLVNAAIKSRHDRYEIVYLATQVTGSKLIIFRQYSCLKNDSHGA